MVGLVGLVGSGGFLVVLGCCLHVLLWTAATCVGLVGLLKVALRFCFGFAELVAC